MMRDVPPVIGHRGAAALAPENTLAGFRAAARLGVRMVEFDAKLSADGVPLLMHDDTLDRTTNGRGPVREAPWAALADLDAGGWFGPDFAGERIPTLTQALDTCCELGLAANVEIKPCPGRAAETATAVAETIRQVWPGDRTPPLVSSFSMDALEVARETAPWAPRGVLRETPATDWDVLSRSLEPATVHLNWRAVTATVVAALSARSLPVLVYTVNDAGTARRLFGMGVGGVFTDDPDAVMPVVPEGA